MSGGPGNCICQAEIEGTTWGCKAGSNWWMEVRERPTCPAPEEQILTETSKQSVEQPPAPRTIGVGIYAIESWPMAILQTRHNLGHIHRRLHIGSKAQPKTRWGSKRIARKVQVHRWRAYWQITGCKIQKSGQHLLQIVTTAADSISSTNQQAHQDKGYPGSFEQIQGCRWTITRHTVGL